MFNLSPRVWILNADAVFSGQHGAVTQQAEHAGCSRETVYEHARRTRNRDTASFDIGRTEARNRQGKLAASPFPFLELKYLLTRAHKKGGA